MKTIDSLLEEIEELEAERDRLRTALDRIGDAAEVCIIGEQDPAALVRWIERTAREALTPAEAA